MSARNNASVGADNKYAVLVGVESGAACFFEIVFNGFSRLKRHRSWTIAEYICEENNRNFVDAEGKAGVRLSDPLASPK